MKEALHADVCIIGAGPGGCAAALQLAKQGVKAILIDKAKFPRDKVCGDALSGKVMRSLERLDPGLVVELRKRTALEPSWGVTFVAPGGRALRVPFSRETGAVLWEHKISNCLVNSILPQKHHRIIVSTMDGKITCLKTR